MNFFHGFTSVNEIKKEWRRLCFLHHPDVGGDTATMQQVNRQYHEALSRANGQTAAGGDGKDHTYYYNQEREQAVMDKVDELLQKKLAGIEILLVGTWVWVTGDTRPVKDSLKEAGLSWHSKRGMWYWHTPQYKWTYNAKATFSDICETYGVERMQGSRQAQGVPQLV
jgi:hypothetical protein